MRVVEDTIYVCVRAGSGVRGQRRPSAALAHLDAAFDERSDTLAVLRGYPVVDRLRLEPRFKELLRKVSAITEQ